MSIILYQFIFVIGTLLLVISQSLVPNKRVSALVLFFLIVTISIVVGLRGEYVGNDTAEYYNIFHRLKYAGPDSYVYVHIDYLFRELNLFVHKIKGGPELVILIGTIIAIVPYYYLFRNYSSNYWISFAAFLSFGSFFFIHSGLRQSIACGIVLLAYKWLQEGRWLLFLIAVLAACGFHLSAVFALVYFLPKINLNWKLVALIFIPSIIVYIRPQLLHFLFDILFYVVPEKYAKYLLDTEDVTRSGLGIKPFAMYIFGLCFLYAYAKTSSIKDRQIYLLSIMSIAFANFFVNFSAISRLGLFLNPFLCLAFAIFFSNYIYNRDKILVGYFYFALFAVLFLRQSVNDSYSIFIAG
jgi:hypothetical protein